MSGTLFLIGEIVLFMIGATAVGFVFGRLTRRTRPAGNLREVTAERERTSLLEREVDELTNALTEARAAAARAVDDGELQSRAAGAEREAEGLDRRLREAAERIAELESERESASERLREGSERIAELEGERGSDDDRLREAAGRIAELEGERDTQDRGLREATERIAELERQRESEDWDERLREASERITQLEVERDELLEQLTTPRAVAATDTATDSEASAESPELADLRDELERREAEIARLEQVAAEARQLEEALEAREGRIGDLEAALEATAANRHPGEPDAASIGTSMGAGNYADSRLEFDAWDPRDDA